MTDAEPTTTGRAPVNGLNLYVEIHGDDAAGDPPLVLLHGAYGAAGMCAPLAAGLAGARRAIVPERQAHGRTADINRPLRYETMADDIAALLDHLGIDRADVFGYSLSGGGAVRLAMRHPDRVRKLVAAGAPFAGDGMYPERPAMGQVQTPEMFAQAPFYREYRKIAPNPAGFPALTEKMKGLVGGRYAWPEGEVRAIPAPPCSSSATPTSSSRSTWLRSSGCAAAAAATSPGSHRPGSPSSPAPPTSPSWSAPPG